MTAVKGSNPPQLVVVPYRPMRKLFISVGLILLVGFAVVASYLTGYQRSVALQDNAAVERDTLRKERTRLSRQVEELRQEVANLKLGSKVDHQASEEVRNQVIQLKAQVAELEEDITFYRGLMAPTDNARGLTIGSLNVLATGVPRQYNYKLVVQQLATNHQMLSGTLNFTVVGWRDSEQVSIPLYQLSDQVEEESIRLRFRYFQSIEGRLILPEGFEPERIELMARSTGANAATAEKKFGWLVQEN
jgi:outer membrane murein-binding lipoprotein Lpp